MDWWIFAIAAFFFFEQNSYFGWNVAPQSAAELIADGIVLVLFSIAIAGGSS